MSLPYLQNLNTGNRICHARSNHKGAEITTVLSVVISVHCGERNWKIMLYHILTGIFVL